MGFKVKTAPGKITVFHSAEKKALVIKLGEYVDLVPRWRVAGALMFSAFGSGAALVAGALVPGIILGAVALLLAWAAGR